MPHDPQALGGLVVQRRENQALLIWDHGVLMREKVHNPVPTALERAVEEHSPTVSQVNVAAVSSAQPTGCNLHWSGLQVIYWDCLESRALPQFVREQLIRLHRVTGQCLYAAADIVIPCNATFNTKWEVGTTPQLHSQ